MYVCVCLLFTESSGKLILTARGPLRDKNQVKYYNRYDVEHRYMLISLCTNKSIL